MTYSVEVYDGAAVIVDAKGKSIVDVLTKQDRFSGRFHQTPAFAPDMAHKIVAALALADAIAAMLSASTQVEAEAA